MGRVTEEAVENVIRDLVVNRQKKRAIQSMSTKELTRYLVHLYRQGFEAGADAMDQAVRAEAAAKHSDPEGEYEEIKADWDDVLRLIAEVKADAIKLPKGFFEKVDSVPKFYEWMNEQPTIDPDTDPIAQKALEAGKRGEEVRFYIGGRKFAVRELAQ